MHRVQSPDRPKSRPKLIKNPPKIGPGRGREPLGGPKCAPRAPGRLLRALPRRPRSAPRLPKAALEGQEGRSRGPKGAPRRPRWSPSRLQVASESEKADFLKIITFPTENLDVSRLGRPKMTSRSYQIASRSLSRAALGEKNRSRRPVERQNERLGAPRSVEEPVGGPNWRCWFAQPPSPVG